VITHDGRPFNTVSIMEFQAGKVVRETQYFADPFDPPVWRTQWVERMPWIPCEHRLDQSGNQNYCKSSNYSTDVVTRAPAGWVSDHAHTSARSASTRRYSSAPLKVVVTVQSADTSEGAGRPLRWASRASCR
jgi:hypothetical protein